jgi:hypothetical protein
MCEKREKTIQLEGYEHKQCEHGYCYQHNPDWEAPFSFVNEPATKRDIWRWFKNSLDYDCTHYGGVVMGIYVSFNRYWKIRRHCGQKTKLWAQYRTSHCKKCGRPVKELMKIIADCACCGYRFH